LIEITYDGSHVLITCAVDVWRHNIGWLVGWLLDGLVSWLFV